MSELKQRRFSDILDSRCEGLERSEPGSELIDPKLRVLGHLGLGGGTPPGFQIHHGQPAVLQLEPVHGATQQHGDPQNAHGNLKPHLNPQQPVWIRLIPVVKPSQGLTHLLPLGHFHPARLKMKPGPEVIELLKQLRQPDGSPCGFLGHPVYNITQACLRTPWPVRAASAGEEPLPWTSQQRLQSRTGDGHWTWRPPPGG